MSVLELNMPSPSQLAVGAQLITAWMLMNYTLFADNVDTHEPGPEWIGRRGARLGVRAATVCLLVVLLLRPFPQDLGAALFLSLLSVLAPIGRLALSRRASKLEAEFEILVLAILVLGVAVFCSVLDLQIGLPFLVVAAADEKIAASAVLVGLVIWLTTPSTLVVRGIMAKVGVAQTVNQVDYNRGRVIGLLERLLLAGVVAAGEYDALAFLVAAKGLIRSKELEKHDFAEYFLIGTFVSVLLAVLAGVAAKHALLVLLR